MTWLWPEIETIHTLTFRRSGWNVKDVCFDTFANRRLSNSRPGAVSAASWLGCLPR